MVRWNKKRNLKQKKGDSGKKDRRTGGPKKDKPFEGLLHRRTFFKAIPELATRARSHSLRSQEVARCARKMHLASLAKCKIK